MQINRNLFLAHLVALEEFFLYLALYNFLLFSKYRTRMWVSVLLSVSIIIVSMAPFVMSSIFSCPFSEILMSS